MLNTILRNLISNAIKFTEVNGKVSIKAIPENNFLQVCVQDNGIGISPKNIEKLFSLSTNESKKGTSGEKGTGLGLVLCKEFIDMNKGEMWVESELQKGSSFYFTLPNSD